MPSQESTPNTIPELPKLVLRRERGGKQHSKCSSNDSRRPCEQWLEGSRGSLWQKSRTPSKRKRDPDPSSPDTADDDFPKRDARATAMVKEAQRRSARRNRGRSLGRCGPEMSDRHPAPRKEDGGRVSLATIPPIFLVASPPATEQRRTHPGKHRPVAVGETLRRLTLEVLLGKVTEDMTLYLHPVQLGVRALSRM